jgi:saccharopine dehydrogenase-like NADP-dependent oxidoreductase
MNGNPHTYLIIGCGHFGSRAANKLFQKDSHSKIIVLIKEKALQKASASD